MAIDPRIAMGFQMPEQPSRLGMAANALQLKNMLMQGQMQEAEMASKRAELERQAGIRNFLQTTDVNTPEGMAAFRKAYPMEAPKIEAQMLEPQIKRAGLEKDQAQAKKYGTDAQAAEFKLKQDKVNQNLQLLGSVQTPEQAAQWVSAGVTQGLLSMEQAQAEIAKIPRDAQGFAQWKQGQQAAGMTIAQQMEQMWKAKDFGLNQDKFAYQQKNDAANRSVTIRGQNMVDARARESTAATMSKPFEVTGADGNPVLVQQDKAGNIRPVEGFGPKSGSAKPLTDAQAKALLFGSRAQESEKVLAGIGDEYSPAGIAAKQAAGRVPVLGGLLEPAANVALSDKSQQVEQAQRDFINAILRRESGAVIADSEFANAAKQYFPQPGDSDTVKKQKAANRSLAIRGILAEVPEGKRASITDSKPAGGPAVGSVVDGYRFKGGNPADQKNWEKL